MGKMPAPGERSFPPRGRSIPEPNITSFSGSSTKPSGPTSASSQSATFPRPSSRAPAGHPEAGGGERAEEDGEEERAAAGVGDVLHGAAEPGADGAAVSVV